MTGKAREIFLLADETCRKITTVEYDVGWEGTGRHVAVARTELHDADDALIALGTGAYVID